MSIFLVVWHVTPTSPLSFKAQTDLNCRTCHTEHRGPTASLTRIPPGWDPHDQLGFSLKTHRLRMDGTPFECKDCHENGFSGPFDQLTCATCHLKIDQVFAQDHILTFWTDCQSCHDGLDSHGSKFDHNLVPFQLVGLHALTLCSQCHVNARNLHDLQATTQDCFACHQKDDLHLGQFGTKCGVCHTAEGWGKSAQFDHNLAAFKLTGLHVNVTCDACHINHKYKGAPSDCFSCHAKDDKHADQFGTDCASCHIADGWNRAVDHSKFAFQLDGKHATVACENCHKNIDFKNTPTDCFSCHAKDDTHAGQFGAQCETCHTTDGWKPSAFNHANSIFKLTGAHTTVACASCHKDLKFKGTPTTCYACHAANDHHGGKYGTNCAACHTTTAWKPATFDHNLSAFPLTGAHVNVSCTDCHANGIFVGTPKDCYSCHKTKDPHAGKAGTNCATCHTTTAWKPSTFKHTFPLTHGDNSIVACATCHPSATSAYTCFSCREHTVTNMADKHKEVRDYSQTTCAECHANGRD